MIKNYYSTSMKHENNLHSLIGLDNLVVGCISYVYINNVENIYSLTFYVEMFCCFV